MKFFWIAVIITLMPTAIVARDKKPVEPAKTAREQYIQASKSRTLDPPFNPGSLWVDYGAESRYLSDLKARSIDDILIIQISEATNALSSGDSATSKKGNTSMGLPKFFGLEKKITELPSLISTQSDNGFKGSGAAKRTQTLTSTVAARVVDVMPNGNLVIEAVKEIRVDNENQVLIIGGIVRPRDISPQNIVTSNAIADMQIRLNGKGLVSEQLKPGALQRLLMKFFPF